MGSSTSAMFMDDRVPTDMGKAGIAISTTWLACMGMTHCFTIRDPKTYEALPSVSLQARFDATDKLMNTPFFAAIAFMSLKGAIELSGNTQTRWHGTSTTSRWALILYVARMIFDTPLVQISLAGEPKKRMEMTAHHVLSGVAVAGGLVTSRMHFFGCLDMCCEFTTIFLNTLFALKTLCQPGPALEKKVAPVGLSLWFSFVAFRLVLFPLWFWIFLKDIRRNPKASWHTITAYEKFFYPSVSGILFVLSCVWFVPLTRGILKGLEAIRKEKERKKSALKEKAM